MMITVGYRNIMVTDPARAWHHLRNARDYLTAEEKWLKGDWAHVGEGVNSPMCLANTLRHVARGQRDVGGEYGDVSGESEAERLLTAVVRDWSDRNNYDFRTIPDFNDSDATGHDDALYVLDRAIALVAPPGSVVADDIMTEEEKEEIADALDRDFAEQWAQWKANKDASASWIQDLIDRGWKVWGETLGGWVKECEGEDCPDKEKVKA